MAQKPTKIQCDLADSYQGEGTNADRSRPLSSPYITEWEPLRLIKKCEGVATLIYQGTN